MNELLKWQDGIRRVRVLGIALALAASAGVCFGQAPRDLVEEALDQPLDSLEIQDIPIRDALGQIEQRTGLRFAIDDHVLDLMPYGDRTRISVVIREMSVRTGLTQVLDGLGLRLFVEQGDVVIVPAPVLDRVGRRLTIEEVGVLSALAANPWAGFRNQPGKPAFEFHFPPESDPQGRLEAALAQSAAPNALRQLDAACAALQWSWRPEDGRVVFESPKDEIGRRLDWALDLSYQREPLDQLLTDLGDRIGVLVKFEPGALGKVSAVGRTVDLIQRGVSVRQILERICGNTGLRYEIQADGVQILSPVDDQGGPSGAAIQEWVRIGIEVKPGVTLDVFVRQEQLSSELQETMRATLKEMLKSE